MAIEKSEKSTLLFSVAINGYHWMYRDFLNSHKQYANKHGYQYQAVTKPLFTRLGVECCWLKLTLMRQAFLAGFERVMFVDADAYIHSRTPPLSSVGQQDKSILMAKSYTERFNSGVIFARKSSDSMAWLDRVISLQGQGVAEHHAVGWGENGYVIACSEHQPFIGELSLRWNNTHDIQLRDYIRHFSHGPLRTNVAMRYVHKVLSRLTKAYSRFSLVSSKHALEKLTRLVVNQYPIFNQN